LESAVAALAESHRHLQVENAKIRRELTDANRRIRTLDEQLLAANQRRQDASKRIDELIAHLDELDSQLDQELEERPVLGAPQDE
jgi:septal ring factor EnvC (AmiA/AmiB activator)